MNTRVLALVKKIEDEIRSEAKKYDRGTWIQASNDKLKPIHLMRDKWDELCSMAKSMEVVTRPPKNFRKEKTTSAFFDDGLVSAGVGRSVMPQVFVKIGDDIIQVKSRWDVMPVRLDSAGTVIHKIPVPLQTASQVSLVGPAAKWTKEVLELLEEGCGGRLAVVEAQVLAEWAKVEGSVQEISSAHLRKSANRERTAFVKKMADMLSKSPGLTDVSPGAVLSIFRLGAAEIDLLAKFTKRNRADIAVAELDDVVLAQQLSRVEQVLKS